MALPLLKRHGVARAPRHAHARTVRHRRHAPMTVTSAVGPRGANRAAAAALSNTPKGQLILLFVPLVVVAAFGVSVRLIAAELAVAVAVAMAVDAPIMRLREGKWSVPDGALLTGLIVAMILQAAGTIVRRGHHQPQIAIASKYLFRVRSANIFNPAALALVATFYLFNTGQSWWGALGDLPFSACACAAVRYPDCSSPIG